MKPKKATAKPQELLRKNGMPVMYRHYEIRAEDINEEDRTLRFPFSSEYEVERWGWVETLGHGKEELDLERLNNGGAYLMDHRWGDQRGVVKSAWIDQNRGWCEVKISRNDRGEELLRDHIDGIRTHVSVGYRIHEMVLERTVDGVEHYRITRWEPMEVSSVSVPADPTVGLGRSEQETKTYPVTIREADPMEDDVILDQDPAKETPAGTRSDTPDSKPAAVVRAPVQPATPVPADKPNDAQRIAETAEQYGAVELGNEYIRSAKSYEEFREALTGKLHEKRSDPLAETTAIDLDMPTSDLRRYSVVTALRAAATGNWKNAGLERQVSESIAERMGKDPDGVFLSYEAMGFGLRQQLERQLLTRQQSAGGAGKGAELVATELHAELFIEMLRARATIGGLGARFMTGLVGDVDIPKQSGSATFYWVAEDGSATDSDIDFTTVQLRPKTIATAVPITRRLMIQSTPDIEALVRDDIMLGLALGIDNALLKGSGAGSEPTGIINTSGIGAVDLTGGPTWADVVELETDIAEANANAETMAYVMRPSMRGTLKTTEKAASTGQFIWGDSNQVNGYRAAVTTEMAANTILAGDFSQAMVGMWGALDVVPDRATKVASGGLVMRLFQDADVAIRHAQAFSYGS